MDPAEVQGLLDELRRRLLASGTNAEIYVIGGSAMALNFPDDADTRMTRDIDAVLRPAAAVRRVVDAMAAELGLSPTWLNSNGASFVPPRHGTHVRAASGVHVTVATIEELIAMKLAFSREQDLHDLGILARHAGITDPEHLVDIAFAAYGEESVILTETRDDYLIMAKQALERARRRKQKR